MRYDLNEGWRFSLSEGNTSIDFDDGGWQLVTLPHTWNAEDCATGASFAGEKYYRGCGCYRKTLVINEFNRLFIEFKGANTVTELYVNGKFVGRHEGGYSAFRFDMTDFAVRGENIIAVKVNSAPTDYIAPITNQGDFTKQGGIYRGVSLITAEPLHIDLMDYGSSGIYITPKNITKTSADIGIEVKLANYYPESRQITVKAVIRGGVCEESAEREITVASGKSSVTLDLPIKDPILWQGRENPYLYQAEITLSENSAALDSRSVSFGIREYHIDPEEGFFLNGRYLDLRGVNYHQDSFENGWAMSDAQRDRDYGMIADMGCTAVRMAHYQHVDYEYELCDRLGLAVWTEIGIVNKMSPDEGESHKLSEGFAENAKRQLTELIRQNYNHPSIIVWGISNELHQMTDEIFALYEELNALAKSEDKTRLTVYADNQFWGRFLKLPADVVGYNRYFGWYKEAGGVECFGGWLDEMHAAEKRPACLSEYGGGGAISQHKDNVDWNEDIDPCGVRHYENYQSRLHEVIWEQLSARKYLWGKFIWCMFDFASDGRNEGETNGQNDKGLVTRNRVKKDAFYFYQSVWSENPMLHLTEKRFDPRPALVPQVKAYSNADNAELFVNGVSMGRVCGESVFVWENIQLTAGENMIEVKSVFPDGTVLNDTAKWTGLLV